MTAYGDALKTIIKRAKELGLDTKDVERFLDLLEAKNPDRWSNLFGMDPNFDGSKDEELFEPPQDEVVLTLQEKEHPQYFFYRTLEDAGVKSRALRAKLWELAKLYHERAQRSRGLYNSYSKDEQPQGILALLAAEKLETTTRLQVIDDLIKRVQEAQEK